MTDVAAVLSASEYRAALFYAWRDDRTWARINHYPIQVTRVAQASEGSPSAGVIDG